MKALEHLQKVTHSACLAQEQIDAWTDLEHNETPDWSALRTVLDVFNTEISPRLVLALLHVAKAADLVEPDLNYTWAMPLIEARVHLQSTLAPLETELKRRSKKKRKKR